MIDRVNARYRGGVIEPLERLDLPEGQELTVTIITDEAVSTSELEQRRALGAQMKAFSVRLATRHVNLSELVLESRRELAGDE